MAFRRYVSEDYDTARWEGFEYRDGDIVVSTRFKHGTTWMQMILQLLVHRSPDLPGRLVELTPWLDHVMEPREVVFERLATQRQRRVIKTHAPLDGIPLDDRASYVVVARHPLDAAVSFHHQVRNIDRRRVAELTGEEQSEPDIPPVEDWLASWIDRGEGPDDATETLPKALWHLADAWARRHQPNVVLVHFDDLRADLAGSMRALAARLDLPVDEATWPSLVEAATLDSMRSRADRLAPDPVGML